MKRWFAIWLVCCSFGTLAQPGYQGKKFIGKYTNVFFPRLNVHFTDISWNFNMKHSLELEYITNRTNSLNFKFQFYTAHVLLDDRVDYQTTVHYNDGTSDLSQSITFLPDEEVPLHGYTFGANYRAYSKLLAPLGAFSEFELLYTRFKMKPSSSDLRDIDNKFYDDISSGNGHLVNQSLTRTPDLNFDKGHGALVLSVGYGIQRVLYDKITFTYGLQFGFAIGGVKGDTEFDINSNFLGYTEENYVKLMGRNRLWGHHLINTFMGVGYLIR